MQITLNTSEASTDELTALIALLASLGGRLPAAHKETVEMAFTVDTSQVRAAFDELREEAGKPLPSEQLMAVAAERAAPPPPADEPAAQGDPNERDSEGLPWDERIHSGNRAKNAAGTWRKRRGVDEITYGRVHAELTERYADTGTASDGTAQTPSATATTPVAPPPPATSPAPPPPPPADTGNVPAPPAPENAPTAAGSPAPEVAASAPAATDDGPRFADFPAFVAAMGTLNKNYNELNQLAGMVGVEKFGMMKDHADKWDEFYEMAGGQ